MIQEELLSILSVTQANMNTDGTRQSTLNLARFKKCLKAGLSISQLMRFHHLPVALKTDITLVLPRHIYLFIYSTAT